MTRVVVYDRAVRRTTAETASAAIDAGVWIDGVLRANLMRRHTSLFAELRAVPTSGPTWRGDLRAVLYHGDLRADAGRIVLNNLALFPRPEAATLKHPPYRKETA